MLKLKNITKVYGTNDTQFKALDDLNISFPKSAFTSILGPSGSGKTTLLNIIGGLDHYTDGDLIINGMSTKEYKDVDWDNYRSKRIGFVFQHYNLISHLSIYENLELSLKINGIGYKERRKRCDEVLEKVGLGDQGNKRPNQLSGGQQQRVAIARALINNPDIILADEPTGALDSKSSVVVMEILKEVSKSKLVIMVTHNEDLAVKYSDRIVRIKDGRLDSDTNPPEEKDVEEVSKDKTHAKKSRMGFFTALNISFKNSLTKIFRTIMTCLGCSFGIVGVALVLSLSNGVTDYVGRIESQAASMLPISIYSSSQTFEEVEQSDLNEQYPTDDLLHPYIPPTVSGGSTRVNYINDKYLNYLDWIKEEKGLIEDYFLTRSTSYLYNFTTEFPNGEIKVVDNSASTGSDIINTITSAVAMPNTPFHQLIASEESLSTTYEIVYGEYPDPKNPYEVVLVVDQYNSIPLNTLKVLGIYPEGIDDPIEANKTPVKFEDILNKEYKVFFNDELYEVGEKRLVYDKNGNSRSIISGNQKDIRTLFNDDNYGHEIKITGILRPKEGVILPALGTGICFQPSLNDLILENNDNSNITLNGVHNFSLKRYVNPSDFTTEFLDVFDNVDMGDMMQDLDAITNLISRINRVINKYFDFYSVFTGEVLPNGISDYVVELSKIGADVNTYRFVEEGIESVMMDLLTAYNKGDIAGFYEDLLLIASFMNNYTKIQSVVIYPKNLTTKDEVLTLLDEYNVISSDENDPYHATSEKEQIFYTDIVSSITTSLSQLIDVVSIVMIIFSSVSLIVSCILTAIITYSSVVERTKEIGILRSLGARKHDVGLLFQAESILISMLACVIGYAFSFVLTLPLNYVLNLMYPEYFLGQIAHLTLIHFLVLLLISIFIGCFSGLIPARVASKKDPVEALGTE